MAKSKTQAEKTHWKKLHNPDYLGAYSFQPNEKKTLTIKEVKKEEVKNEGRKEECSVAHFIEDEKPMILNVTNSKTIQKIYKTPYIEDWAGKKITLYVTMEKHFGEDMDVVRIIPKEPVAKKPELTPNHKRWEGAKKAIAEGTATVESIQKHFEISEENKEKLLS